MGCKVEISDIVRMIRECAPDAVMRVATHSILVRRGNLASLFSKGEGSPKKPEQARGEEHERVVRKVVNKLGIALACARKYFPGLLDEEGASASSNGRAT